MMPISTEDEITPEDIVTLVSCNLNGECSNNHCTCKKNNVCTDFCGYGDLCQNTDMRPNFHDEFWRKVLYFKHLGQRNWQYSLIFLSFGPYF